MKEFEFDLNEELEDEGEEVEVKEVEEFEEEQIKWLIGDCEHALKNLYKRKKETEDEVELEELEHEIEIYKTFKESLLDELEFYL